MSPSLGNPMKRPTEFEVIAEIANAHQGDPETASQMAEAFAQAGADAVKFQVYFADELLTPDHSRYEHFERQSFAPEIWAELLPTAKRCGVAVYCDVFGAGALEVAARHGADGYKLHASDLSNEPLLDAVADKPGRVFLSAGGATIREITRSMGRMLDAGKRPVLLHGFQGYPTRIADSRLGRLAWLRGLFGEDCDLGYADHVAGDDPFSLALPLFAMGLGATVIEKHVTFDRAAKGVDYFSSIEPEEFRRFVAHVRNCDLAMSDRPDGMSDAELDYRRSVKKHWVAGRDLDAGSTVMANDLAMKRVEDAPGEPLPLQHLVGRRLLQNVPVDTRLPRRLVETTVWALPVARSRSSRLPGKALIDLAGRRALAHMLERLKQCAVIDRIVFCTTTALEDDALCATADGAGIDTFRGPGDDVLARMVGAMGDAQVDIVLRATGDDILIDPDYVTRAVHHHLDTNAEYTDAKALPSGTEVEVFDGALLRELLELAADSSGTEYLTNYIIDNMSHFRCSSLPVPERHAHDWRLTLDTPEDLEVLRRLLEHMADIGKPTTYRLDDIVDYFEANPEQLGINAEVRQRAAPITVETTMHWTRPSRRSGDNP